MNFAKQYAYLLLVLIFIVGCNTPKKTTSYKRSAPKKHVAVKSKTDKPSDVPEAKVSKVVQTARSFTGTPYKWGGTTRAGMDCSGLMLISFQSAGINLPRTSDAQSQYGKKSSLDALQVGDLVFFATNKGNGKISHVGLVTEVNGKREVKFIHASTKLGVVENNLYSDYYRKIFVKARRPL